MPGYRHRALLAAVVPALLLSTDASAAVCVERICAPSTVEVPSPSAIGEVIDVDLPGDDTGGGDGVVCLYVKKSGPPPTGWGGAPDSKPPYVWQHTKGWGDTYRGDWDFRACAPACGTWRPLEVVAPCPAQPRG